MNEVNDYLLIKRIATLNTENKKISEDIAKGI